MLATLLSPQETQLPITRDLTKFLLDLNGQNWKQCQVSRMLACDLAWGVPPQATPAAYRLEL